MKTIDELANSWAFNYSDLQTFRNILMTLQIHKFGIKDLLEWMIRREHGIVTAAWKQCEVCTGVKVLYQVNTKECNQVPGDYSAQFFCDHCGDDEYLTEEEASAFAEEFYSKFNKVRAIDPEEEPSYEQEKPCKGCGGK